MPFEMRGVHIFVHVLLDGRELGAILDTGAYDTAMSLDRAVSDFALDRNQLQRSRHCPFRTLSFGGVNVASPAIELVPDRESGVMGRGSPFQMIVGMGVLRRLHLYISYKEKRIYVTPTTQY